MKFLRSPLFVFPALIVLISTLLYAADVRIKDIATTATGAAADDYVALDGATNGTRKILGARFLSNTTTTWSGVANITTTGNITANVITGNNITVTDFTTTNLTISGTITGVIPGANGGTGVANTGKTITLGGNLTTSGAHTTTLTTSANTNITLPTTGTLATTAQLTKESITSLTTADSPQFTGVNIGHASDTTITRTSAGNLAVEGNALFRVGGSFVGLPDIWVIAIGDETTAITTGTAKVTFRAPYAATVTAVRASLTTASSSGLPTFDINEGGTTILSTKLTIDASEKTSTTAATAAVISDSALADDAEITIDVDTAGTGAAGGKIVIYVTRA